MSPKATKDYNLEVLFPDLLGEWDYDKNEKKPSEYSPFSNSKVWWKCSKGHEWVARIAKRAMGSGCPFCSGNKVSKDNSLAVKYPKLVKEWVSEKNEFTPFDYTSGSNEKVWWRCENGHEWKAVIKSRTRGIGCPYCAGNLPTKENNLVSIYPRISAKWHPTKNKQVTPEQVTPASNRIFWWRCENGHEWRASVKSMKNGFLCSYCSGRKVGSDNNFAVTHPELAREWHPTKNGSKKPTDYTAKMSKKVWWQCEHGHEWQATIHNRAIQGSGCPECYNENRGDIYRDFAVRRVGSLLDNDPELALEWNYEKNGDLKPSEVTLKSSMKVWWKCNKGHEWEATLNSRSYGSGCPYCSGKIASPEHNLAQRFPGVAKEWHPTKNSDLKPSDFTPHSGEEVWWLCPEGHEYIATISHKSSGRGCPFCAGKQIDDSNSLATLYPDIAREWHPSKNGELTPDIVTSGSGRMVWWLCSQGHEYPSLISSRTKGRGCPFCSPKTSRIEIRLLTELETIFENVKHREVFDKDFECDIFIPSYNLGIEVDGYWHKDRTERDIDKQNYFMENGINFIRVRDRRLGEKIESDIYYREGEKHLTIIIRLLQKITQYQKISKKDQDRISEYLNKNILQNQKEYQRRTRYIKTVLPEQSLEYYFPDVAKEWNFEKNHPLLPSSFSPFSHRKVSWKCAKGHTWEASIATRSSGYGCPKCSGRVASKENNLAYLYPELAKQWHPTKNGDLSPIDVTYGSNKRVWWIDKEGNEWQARIKHRTTHYREHQEE